MTSHPVSLAPQFQLRQQVRTRRSIPFDENDIPAGSVGTVVYIYKDVDAFEIEFPNIGAVPSLAQWLEATEQ